MNQGASVTAAEARNEPYSEPTLTDHALAEEILAAQERIADNESVLHALRIEVQRRIEDSGGTMLDDPDFKIELKPGPVTYDVGILVPLKEQLSEENLAKVYTSADDVRREMKVSDKWDGQQLNALARRFGVVARIVERARIPGRPKVVVERKS